MGDAVGDGRTPFQHVKGAEDLAFIPPIILIESGGAFTYPYNICATIGVMGCCRRGLKKSNVALRRIIANQEL